MKVSSHAPIFIFVLLPPTERLLQHTVLAFCSLVQRAENYESLKWSKSVQLDFP